MRKSLRFLVAESESPEDRKARRSVVGRSSGETYISTLRELSPGADCSIVRPAEGGHYALNVEVLADYDAVFITGSPLHLYDDTPEVQAQLRFMHAVFASGTPAFGSCAGLQIAAVAAGGRVRAISHSQEAGFARRITPTLAGRDHPLLAGRPLGFDAPSIHSDEVETLPDRATLLATNTETMVQAAEIRCGPGVFWGVQYHPELTLAEVGGALRRQIEILIRRGLARTREEIEFQAELLEALDRDPQRADLAWRLGLNRETTDASRRRTELRNFINLLVEPTRIARSRN